MSLVVEARPCVSNLNPIREYSDEHSNAQRPVKSQGVWLCFGFSLAFFVVLESVKGGAVSGLLSFLEIKRQENEVTLASKD